ncbi:PPE domain-containing protein [Amycolatopsis aidingensis]|uniref:PPE domain-containing protein n=1 Tax=Amycolatopsis aidingensis TaxID=2842453 RepID=UPI001C0DA130|nr:PPE domain-containing protein [Amycolatopsis aidingensis]
MTGIGAGIGPGPLSAAEIYDQVHGGPGPDRLSAAQQAATALNRELTDCAEEVAALGGEIQEGWQGEAGSAAANAAAPLADAARLDADHLRVADRAVADQIGAFDRVRASVVPVASDPPPFTVDDLVSSIESGRDVYGPKLAQWQAASDANVQAFSTYHGSSLDNGHTMPSAYAPLADSGAPVALAGATGAGDGGGPMPSPPAPVQRPEGGGEVHRPPRVEPGGPPTQVPPPVHATGPDPAPAPAADRQATASPGDDGTGAAAATAPVGTPGGGGYQFGPTGTPVSNLGTDTGTGGPARGGGAVGPDAVAGRPGNGAGAGTGRPGVGAAPGPGRMSRGVPPGNDRVGRTVGTGAAGSGAAGTGGRGGPSGVPVGAAGAGRAKDSDQDHQRPEYLKEPDPEGTYGGPEGNTVPPVIGREHEPGPPR